MNNEQWKDLGFSEKTKIVLSIFLIIASVILGYISFVILFEIPESVIGINVAWLSASLGLLGITAYVNTSVLKMQTKINDKIEEIDKIERNRQKEAEI